MSYCYTDGMADESFSPGRCAAAHPEDRTLCEGPIDAVKIVDVVGEEVTGCVHHGAVLLASLRDGRVYPGPGDVDGAAIEVYNRARHRRPFDLGGSTC